MLQEPVEENNWQDHDDDEDEDINAIPVATDINDPEESMAVMVSPISEADSPQDKSVLPSQQEAEPEDRAGRR